ncbi:MAG TPA: Ig-like domain-containing protein [Vicinamibacterales bacterium]|nr:Ig-like domain-containing protein [Vicinamibacterales bacterium]
MAARQFRIVAPLLLVAAVSFAIGGCQKVPLLAPSGSSITLTASNTAVPVNGTVRLTAQILEAAGTPPHSGTLVTFTTTLGTIEPASVETDANGLAVTTFKAGTANGDATITANSGGASAAGNNAVKVAVGTAGIGRVAVNANPTQVPSIGGSSLISATVFDVNGNALPSALVSFSTTAGSLSATVGTTDANGVASTTLQTSSTAIVTASAGATSTGTPTTPTPPATGGTPTTPTTPTPGTTTPSSASVTVNISAAPTLVITAPTTPPSAGLPAIFTFVVTPAAQNGSAVRDLTVRWGDGGVDDLGAVTGSQPASHVYANAGTFTVTATLVDASGNSFPQSSPVTVIPVPRPSIIVTFTPALPRVNDLVTFNIQVTAATGIGVQSTVINFGDGTSQSLGGASSASVSHSYVAAGTFTVTVTVVDTTGQSTPGTTVVSVSP